MAIKQLSEEQVRTMTVEEKDRWWLANVFRGDMPQLTLRSALTGFVLGGFLSATNLYVGAKTGWTLGVGLTSVILAFAAFRLMASMRIAKDFTILENNCTQSIATSAGYMTGPLISGLAAYMMVKDEVIPFWHMVWFSVVLSILGVLVAFPMKRRFINDEQAPFPEGAACGVVLDTLYTADAKVGMFKAKALAVSALAAGLLKFFGGHAYQYLIQVKLFGQTAFYSIAENLDTWYYKLVEAGRAPMPSLFGIDPRKLGLSPTLELALFGAGGLMNIRYAVNMIGGMILAYVFLGPHAINNGWVFKRGVPLTASDAFGFRDVLTSWILWPGVAILVMGSMTAFFAKPQVIISAFTGLFKKKDAGQDVLRNIEVPLSWSFIGVPIVGAVSVWMAHAWFDVDWEMGALAIPLIIVLTLIAANSTAATSITPTGSLSKITQFTFGVLRPQKPQVNLMTSVMTIEVASNASNLMMDIKPGYMLGAKPRQQAIGHVIGIVAGAIASTPLFFIMFLKDHPQNPFMAPRAGAEVKSIEETLVSPQYGFPSAVQWKGIADFMKGLSSDQGLSAIIHPSAITALAIAAVLGIILEALRIATKGKSYLSPVALGLGFVLPPDSTFWMFLGSFFFWMMAHFYTKREGSLGHSIWVATKEPICAGLIAGTALVAVGDTLLDVFVVSGMKNP